MTQAEFNAWIRARFNLWTKSDVDAEVRKAVEQALAQQEPWCMKMNGCKTKCKDCPVEVAQPKQEPVADDFFKMIADRNPKPFSPPERTWVGLTDEEMEATFMQCGGKWNGDFWKIEDADFHSFLRTIEAKLKERNT
jgi:hypothetical protein